MEIKNDKNRLLTGTLRGGGILRRFRTGWLAALILLTASCSKEPQPEGDVPQPGSDIAVTLKLTPEKMLMPGADGHTVRSGAGGIIDADKSGGMSLELLAQPEDPATRAETRAAEELNIANAWILQFDGEDKLVRKGYLSNCSGSSEVEFLPGASRIVVLANSYDPNLCDGLDLQKATYADVAAMPGPAVEEINANQCMPMSGTTTTLITEGMDPIPISLKSIVAKVTLKVKIDQGLPADEWTIQPQDLAPAYWMPDTGEGVWPAAEQLKGDAITATTDITLSTEYATYTWYLPINRRGSVAGTVAAQRKTNAPEGATYIKLCCDQIKGDTLERKSYYIHLGANFTTDYNLKAHTHYTYLTRLLPDAGTDSRVVVQKYETVQANCGLVIPGSGVAFDVTDRKTKVESAAEGLRQSLNWTLGTEYTPLVIWQDVKGLISDIDYSKTTGCLTVTTDAAKGAAGGNAVVGLFPKGTTNPAAGTCIWSWHVWATDYQPDGTANYGLSANQKADVAGGQVHVYGTNFVTTIPGKVIMDRNLGATAALYELVTTNEESYPTYGLFYQWGRKDPFPKAPIGYKPAGTVVLQATYNASGAVTNYPIRRKGPVTILNATQNPHVFYYNTTDTNFKDWNSSPNAELWGEGTVKSVYDPCPEGWHIAPIQTWHDFGRSGAGYITFTKNPEWVGVNDDSIISNDQHIKYTNIAGGLYPVGDVKAFYPGAGSLRWDCGNLFSIGYSGYIWSSTISGDNGSYTLQYSRANMRYVENYRSNGFPVRCIQE